LTAEPHPRTRFRKAKEGRWVFHAEVAARECGSLTLAEALELVCLYAEAEPAKFEKAALRWHGRFVAETAPSLLRAHIALAALADLRTGSEPAKKLLIDFASADFSAIVEIPHRCVDVRVRGNQDVGHRFSHFLAPFPANRLVPKPNRSAPAPLR
jgi:hypothetical protein